jgi:hypothetical protein
MELIDSIYLQKILKVIFMNLYHAGFNIIEEIELNYGRKNADFGQGFYLSPEHHYINMSQKYKLMFPNEYFYKNTYYILYLSREVTINFGG